MNDRARLHTEPGCSASRCGLPAGFFRLRYFHGKQMRLADYVDEQRYHAGKMRFHNQRLHGAGILCGLKVSAVEAQGLWLRVGRGAAIDDCGREIVVGWDQCVDVGAWFKQQKRVVRDNGHDPCKPDEDRQVHICVVLRYAECAAGPEPAPKAHCTAPASCGCDTCAGAGGCAPCPDPCNDAAEYGRVTEEFELRLMFADEARRVTAHELFPTKDDIEDAVARAFGGIGLLQSLAVPMRERCPAADEGWLLLACFDLVIDAGDPEKIDGIVDIDQDCASQVLLSTEVMQYLLARLVEDADLDIGGPEIAAIEFIKVRDDRYQFRLKLTHPIDGDSLDEDSSFNLRELTHGGWSAPPSRAVTMVYKPAKVLESDVDGPTIYIDVDNAGDDPFLEAGGRYQLYTPADAEPVVDEDLRALRPRRLMWRFGIEMGEGGELVMSALADRGSGHG
jgi:hypothetical protein